jgi:hypothetical protein
MRRPTSHREAVLLLDDTHVRVVGLTAPVPTIVERRHVTPGQAPQIVRWHWFGERDLVGNRIFRTAPPPGGPLPGPLPDEAPLTDEVNVHVPLSPAHAEELAKDTRGPRRA